MILFETFVYIHIHKSITNIANWTRQNCTLRKIEKKRKFSIHLLYNASKYLVIATLTNTKIYCTYLNNISYLIKIKFGYIILLLAFKTN